MRKTEKHPQRALIVRRPVVDTFHTICGRITASISHCTPPASDKPFETQLYNDDATALEFGAWFFPDCQRWTDIECTWERSRAMTLHECEKAARIMRPIARRLERMRQEQGAPATIGQAFIRVALALDCAEIIVHDTETQQNRETPWREFFRREAPIAIATIDRQADITAEECRRRTLAA